MTARKRSAQLYDEAFAAFEHAAATGRVEAAETDARIAKLKHAAELEKVGRQKDADRLIGQVERDQRRLGMRS
jgi:hypothetical protein